MSESLEDVEKIVETDNGSSSEVQTNSRSSGYCNGCKIDHTYLRSIEGILRVLTMPLTHIFIVLDLGDYRGAGEWFNLFVAIAWIMYSSVTIIIEVFVPGIHVHRLVDGIMTMIFALMWTAVSIICIVDAARHDSGVLGAAAVFAILIMVILIANAVMALRTWHIYEGGTRGSVALFDV